MTNNEAIAKIREVLVGVAGIGQVADRLGGQVTWAKHPRPKQAYWVVRLARQAQESAGVGRQATERPVFLIEGWMPWSHENPNTTPVWNDLVEAVLGELRRRRTVLGHGGLPQLQADDVVLLGDEHSDAVVCHHAQITVEIVRYATY